MTHERNALRFIFNRNVEYIKGYCEFASGNWAILPRVYQPHFFLTLFSTTIMVSSLPTHKRNFTHATMYLPLKKSRTLCNFK